MSQTRPRRIAVPCGHPGCRQPAAYMVARDGSLVVEIHSRHHGKHHVTHLTVEDAAVMLQLTPEPS